MITLNSSTLRRLTVLQHIADKNRPAQVVATFTSGNTIVTDSAGAVDLFLRMGPSGGLQELHSDHPTFAPWAQLLTVLLHPAPDRRLSDYET